MTLSQWPRVACLLSALILVSGCDKINTANRTLDTMIGGDFEVHILGHEQPYHVDNGKVT